jgi:hypothetical protein
MNPSIPYQASQAVFNALANNPAFERATVLDNPTDPSPLSKGVRIVWLEDQDDSPVDKPGQAEMRTFSFAVGVINRTKAPEDRLGADADMLAAKTIVQQTLLLAGRELVAAKQITTFSPPREGKRSYKVEGIDVGGALILTHFEFDYRTPAVSRINP